MSINPLKVSPLFHGEYFTLTLSIPKEQINLQTKIQEAERFNLLSRDDFHITIIGTTTAKEVLGIIGNPEEEEQKLFGEKIRLLAEKIDWQASFKKEFFYLKKYYDGAQEKRESIIQMVDLTGLQEFYTGLEELLGEELMIPIPHVTLYTNSTKEETKLRGIGIASKEEFNELEPEMI